MAIPVIVAIILFAVLTTSLLIEKVASASSDDHNFLYVASYISGPWSDSPSGGYTAGNIILVNPTHNSLSNLTLAMQVDSSEIINPILRLWDSNYTLTPPNSFLQSVLLFEDLQNFSTPITSINIEPNQKETISLNIPSSNSFQFNSHNLKIYVSQNSFGDSHNLKIYVSQNSFGDFINGQLLSVPQTEAYLQIVNFSAIESEEGTYHQYYNSTLKSNMVTVAYNPNFYQRYHNISKYDIYADNFGIMHHMGALDYSYRNVTVFNNNTFPVNSVTAFGQEPYQTGALINYAIQPSETNLFPVSKDILPSYAYVTGYVISNSTTAQPTPTPTVPEFSWLAILPLLVALLFIAVILKHRKTTK